MSREFNLPLFLHCRAAADDLVDILAENKELVVGGVVHSFDGTQEALDKILALGMYIGINGWLVKFKLKFYGGSLLVLNNPSQTPDSTNWMR